MYKSEKVQEIRQRLEKLRAEAEDEGLVLAVSWLDKKGHMQSVQLTPDDNLYVTVRR